MLELHMLESRLKEEDYMLIKAKCKLINIQDKGMWRYVKECLSHISVWGSNMWVFTERSTIKKVDPLESRSRSSSSSGLAVECKLIKNAQGKGMILIGFLIYRSRGVVGRPGFRIGNRTIKRGSQVSFSVSVVESSNLCIVGIIFIGSYLALIVVWYWCLSWQGQGHRKRFSYVSS